MGRIASGTIPPRRPFGRKSRIAIAGSRALDDEAARQLFAFVLTVIPKPTILLRRGRGTKPGNFERELARLCRLLAIDIEWWKPPTGGRSEVMYRDIDMAKSADLVVGVFAPGTLMEGGTAHLIEKAGDVATPAYGLVYEDHHVRRVGEYDPEHTWEGYFQWLA